MRFKNIRLSILMKMLLIISAKKELQAMILKTSLG